MSGLASLSFQLLALLPVFPHAHGKSFLQQATLATSVDPEESTGVLSYTPTAPSSSTNGSESNPILPRLNTSSNIEPVMPVEAGCYAWAAGGCPLQPSARLTGEWVRDVVGEAKFGSGQSRTACAARNESFSRWCGAKDVKLRLVVKEPEVPTMAGCFVWAPYGCPNMPSAQVEIEWVRDVVGEDSFGASRSRAACAKRNESWKSWCGTNHVMMRLAVDEPPKPTVAGCYAWAPSGCPKTPAAQVEMDWVRDAVGEADFGAGNNRMACANRSESWNTWCGVTDVKLHLVAEEPEQPTKSGCFVWAPSGCPKVPSAKVETEWVQDMEGERAFSAGVDQPFCEARQTSWNDYCGVQDMKMLFSIEHPPYPTEPGCYLWLPSGCPKRPNFTTDTWKHDKYGEKKMYATEVRSICEKWRRQQFKGYCGADDLMVHFVQTTGDLQINREPPPLPTAPGCYVWTPMGCPKRPSFGANASAEWLYEDKGPKQRYLSGSKEMCEVDRAMTYSEWCGDVEVKMAWVDVDEAPLVGVSGEDLDEASVMPNETGCHMRSTYTCSYLPSGARERWVLDAGFEGNSTNISDLRSSCLERKEMWDDVCGTKGVEMLYYIASPPAPVQPGCYIFAPEGCLQHPWFKTKDWMHDTFGEESLSAAESQLVCEETRRQKFNRYCGIDNMRTRFIAPFLGPPPPPSGTTNSSS